jgi:hypothetical protein
MKLARNQKIIDPPKKRSIALILSPVGLLLISAGRLIIVSNYNATTAVTIAASGQVISEKSGRASGLRRRGRVFRGGSRARRALPGAAVESRVEEVLRQIRLHPEDST